MKNLQRGFAFPLLIAILALLAIGGGFYVYQNKSAPNPNTIEPGNNIVGGDKDEHGCISSAGYSWCEVKNKCLRVWEEKCETNPATADETANWKTYEDTSKGFSLKYPSSWTYQTFRCNVDGVAFCSLSGNSPSNCRQTCADNSPESPIYLHFLNGTPAINEGNNIKYWANPNISLTLMKSENREIYMKMISSFKFIISAQSTQPEKQIGYIKSIYQKNGKYYLDIDYVQMFSDKGAIKAALEDDQCFIEGKTNSQAIIELANYDINMGLGIYGNCAPNGYYIRNQNPLLRTFPISKNVQTKLQTYSHDPGGDFNWNQIVSLPILIDAINGIDNRLGIPYPYSAEKLLYQITLNNGVVTNIIEQYQP